MMKFADPIDGRELTKDPAVVRFNGYYYLYYSVHAEHDQGMWTIGIARSCDLNAWSVVGHLLPSQECEKKGLCAPGAIVLGGAVHLFYQTYGNGRADAICHAVSRDGVSFERDAGNPVFSPRESWCCGRAIDADVCVFRGRLYMYFASRDHEMRTQKLGGASAPLDSAFSRGDWTPLANRSLLHPELVWEGECIEAPAATVRGGRIYLFYGGAYNCKPQQIGCASSSDGLFFERISETPFLPCGKKGEWNESESGHPFVFTGDDNRTYLFYQGSADGGKSWYLSYRELAFENGLPRLI